MLLSPNDPRITWQGAISFQDAGEWLQPWRLPYEDLALFPPDALRERAAMPAGVRISFHSDATTLAGRIEPSPEASPLDILCDGLPCGSAELVGQSSFAFHDLPPGEKLIELWLPQFGEFRLRSLEAPDGATIAPYDDPRPRWITYGSSITHCRTAESPSLTWPAIVAREHGLNLTCLGYGGNCHLEPMVARMMRALPADFISIKVGINVYGNGSLNLRTFRPAVIGFVEILREGHPNTPLAVISPIYSPSREETPNAVEFTLRNMREEVAEAVSALQGRGDRNIHYVDGLKLFGSEYTHMLPDGLHPDPEGYKTLGYNFLREVATPLFRKAAASSAP